MFPGSGARLSGNHHSNAGSVWLLNFAQEAQSSLMPDRCRMRAFGLFSKLSNFGQTRKALTS
jgi:hypothetical protein